MSTVTIPKRFELEKFFPLTKVDSGSHTAYGLATCEKEDKDGEICDYEGAKKAYQEWSQEALESTTAAGQEKSLGNIRYMHRLILAGKATKIRFDDVQKQIWLESTPAPPLSKDDPDVWPLLERGFLRGYSQGGKYASRVCNECRKDISGNFCNHCDKRVLVRYVPTISEVSYVDNPCLKEATFSVVKADGSVELRKFATDEEKLKLEKGEIPTVVGAIPSTTETPAINVTPPCTCDCASCKEGDCVHCTGSVKCQMSAKASAQVELQIQLHGMCKKEKKKAGVKYLVTDNEGHGYLPYTGPDGKPNHRLMGAAWAALFSPGGHRGNKYSGPNKEQAKSKLKGIYQREGMKTPSEKADFAFNDMLKTAILSRDYSKRASIDALVKGMYTVGRFAELTESLKYLWQSLEYEREMEGDESPVTDSLKEMYMELLDHLLAYTEEEVAEAKEFHNQPA